MWTTEDQTVAVGHSVAVDPTHWQELFDELLGRAAGRFGGGGPPRPPPRGGVWGGCGGAGRGPIREGGASPAGQGVRARAAGRPATQELLDDRRARRRPQPRWDAAPAWSGGLGPRRGPR